MALATKKAQRLRGLKMSHNITITQINAEIQAKTALGDGGSVFSLKKYYKFVY